MRAIVPLAALLFGVACGNDPEPPPESVSCTNASCVCPAGSSCGFGACERADNCAMVCSASARCLGECGRSCTLECASNASCTATVGESGTVTCADNATCEVTCAGACSLACAAGATCALTCGTSEKEVPGGSVGTCP